MNIKDSILNLLNDEHTPPQTAHNIISLLEISKKEDVKIAFEAMRELEEEGKIIITKKNKLTTAQKLGIISGVYEAAGVSGGGFVEGENEELFIPSRSSFNALPGDSVLAVKTKPGGGGKRPEGEIIRIVKKFDGLYTGIIRGKGKQLEFFPDNVKFPARVIIPSSKSIGAKSGNKVSIRVEASGHSGILHGAVVKNYGNANTVMANYMSVLDYHRIRVNFPDDALTQAKYVFANPEIEKELPKRKDLRNELIFTIDGADALDLDDAISIEKTENGYILGVHIADVSHYVTHKSPLDAEAMKRGTSVYFADKVVPMLPKELSNGICSLNPNEDKLALSAVMKIDNEGGIKSYDLFESVIRSTKKCIYEEINKIFDNTANSGILKSYEKLIPTLNIMRELSAILSKKKSKRGALDFEMGESKVVLDENNKVIEIKKRETGVTQRLIEDFMLSANEAVATYAYYLHSPFVYRIHEKPSSEKVVPFLKIASVLGYVVKGKTDTMHSTTLQSIINKFKDTPYERMISTLALRSLMKAKYSPNCIGHYGLALQKYCHFTSPIRRYPDLVCHRILKMLLNGKSPERLEEKYGGFAAAASLTSSECEVRAMTAERDIEDLFKTEYMSYHIGEEFDGIISSVTNFGFYIELENTVEGLVRIATLKDDYYDFIEEHLCFIGSTTKKKYSIGDNVRILVSRADISSSQIDFELIDNIKELGIRSEE